MTKRELKNEIEKVWEQISPADKKEISIFYSFNIEHTSKLNKTQLVDILQAIQEG